jgi:hypothetical protein
MIARNKNELIKCIKKEHNMISKNPRDEYEHTKDQVEQINSGLAIVAFGCKNNGFKKESLIALNTIKLLEIAFEIEQ